MKISNWHIYGPDSDPHTWTLKRRYVTMGAAIDTAEVFIVLSLDR